MKTTATFSEAYERLEREFAVRVEEDNKEFEKEVKEGKYRSIYLPNCKPTGPVDYVLVGMEPSQGNWAKGLDNAHKKIADGFRNGVGETLQYSIKKYLCRNGETYYFTDLAKGAMLTKSPKAGDTKKYEAWYPLFEKELKLIAKPGAKVIAIGSKVDWFLKKKNLCGRVYAGSIPHYSTQAAGHWGKEIESRKKAYEKFAANLQCSKWTESQKKLLFDYKISLKRIRDMKAPTDTGV